MSYPALSVRDVNGNYPEWYFNGQSLPLKVARMLGMMEDGCVEFDLVSTAGYAAILIGVLVLAEMLIRGELATAITSIGTFLGFLAAKGAVKRWQDQRANTSTVTVSEATVASPALSTSKVTTTATPAPEPDPVAVKKRGR